MKVALNGETTNVQSFVTDEHLDEYLPIFEKYFNTVAHHCREYHANNKNALVIYSYFPSNMSCNRCTQEQDTIEIPRDHSIPVGPVFFEELFRNVPCSRVTRIKYGNNIIGLYCKRHNVLCTSDIAHESGRKAHIERIFKELADRKIIREKAKLRNRNRKITLGADPEFEAKIQDKDVSAFDLPIICSRKKEFLSHDGRTQPQRELRPDPANTPEELVDNIRDLIKISSFLGEDLYAVGDKMSLGGHIHVGNAYPTKDIITAMDYFFTPFTTFNSELRKSSKYGKQGDVRSQPHGFEYRTPPSAWLATPQLATMTLQLMKVIVEKLINGIEVVITDSFRPTSYEEDLLALGFSQEWCDEFATEISNIKTNLKLPLAKTWNCEVPMEHRVSKTYITPRDDIPSPQQSRVIDIDGTIPDFEDTDEEQE